MHEKLNAAMKLYACLASVLLKLERHHKIPINQVLRTSLAPSLNHRCNIKHEERGLERPRLIPEAGLSFEFQSHGLLSCQRLHGRFESLPLDMRPLHGIRVLENHCSL